ncbi:MAG: hypothetical protein RL272_570 [Candidatus Parcubacteria bacterium]|jgi:hypothetical protein
MNLLKVIALFIAGSAREIAHEGKETLRLTRNLLILAVLLPLLLLILGVGLGALGESLDSTGTVGTGQGLIVVGAFLASLLLGFVLVRSSVLGYVMVAGSKLASKAFDIFPGLETEEVKNAARKLSGIMAFITGACLYAQVVPIWRAVGISLIAATSMLGLAYVMASGWYNGKWAKVALTSFMLLSLAFSTARIASPRFARALAEFNQRQLGPDRISDTDSRLLRRFTEERDAIRRRAADDCGGNYCSETDRARVEILERNIALLQSGTYWDTVGRNSPAAVPASTAERPSVSPPSASPVGSTSSADLPPPPPVPRRDPPASATAATDTAPTTASSHPVGRAHPRTDEIFRELDQYQDPYQ